MRWLILKKLLILFFLIIIPIVSAIECQRVTPPKDIPCTIISTWTPSTGCTETLQFFSQGGDILQNTTWSVSTPFCNATFNISDSGTYIYNSSIESGVVVVQSEDNMTSLGVILFLMALNFALFYSPFVVNFSNNKPTHFVIRNMVWVLAWVLLTFNTTILATLSDNAGLGITHELFVFQWFFLKAIYILCIVVVIRTLLLIPKLLKEQRQAKRMGTDEG